MKYDICIERGTKEMGSRLSWIKDPDNLPKNKCAALAKLKSTEERLRKYQSWAQIYKWQIDDMVSWSVTKILLQGDDQNIMVLHIIQLIMQC